MRAWNWLKKTAVAIAKEDPVSWWSHWVIVGASTILIAAGAAWAWGMGVGGLLGLISSEIWLILFTAKEIDNIKDHKAAGDDMKRWRRDGIRDYLGPLGIHIIWWAFFLVQIGGV